MVEHRPSDPIVVGSSPAASAITLAQIAQLVDAAGLRSAKCRFESGFGYHDQRFCSVVINTPPCHGGDREFDSRQNRH